MSRCIFEEKGTANTFMTILDSDLDRDNEVASVDHCIPAMEISNDDIITFSPKVTLYRDFWNLLRFLSLPSISCGI